MREQQIQSINEYIDLHKTEMIRLPEEFVEIPSCSREPEVMPAATAWVTGLLRREGFAVRTLDLGHGNAPVVIADLDGQAGLERPVRLILAGDEEINHLSSRAAEMGLAEIGQIWLGDSSDAAYITMEGVPCLCSCGTMGGWNHTVREYILTDSLYERAKLFAGALLNADNFRSAD